MKCTKCNKKARFISPGNWCSEHWLEWWYEDLDMNDLVIREEYEKDLREALAEDEADDDYEREQELKKFVTPGA